MSFPAAAMPRRADASRREVENEKEKRGKMKEGLLDPIYKEKGNRWARKTRTPKNDYLAIRTPRFLG